MQTSSSFPYPMESTLAHYQYTPNRYILPVLGSYALCSLDEQQLDTVHFPCGWQSLTLGTSSTWECLTMPRRICKYGVHFHLIRPVEILVKLHSTELKTTKPLPHHEQAAVQASILQYPTARKVGLLLQMQLGLRIGEVCGICADMPVLTPGFAWFCLVMLKTPLQPQKHSGLSAAGLCPPDSSPCTAPYLCHYLPPNWLRHQDLERNSESQKHQHHPKTLYYHKRREMNCIFSPAWKKHLSSSTI